MPAEKLYRQTRLPRSFADKTSMNWNDVYLRRFGEPPSVFIDLVRATLGLERMETISFRRANYRDPIHIRRKRRCSTL